MWEWDSDPDKLVAYVVSTNLHRRHLSETQRGLISGRLANLSNGTNQHRAQSEGSSIDLPSVSQAEAADLLNVGLNTVKRARTVIDHGVPELVREVEQDRINVTAAAEIHVEITRQMSLTSFLDKNISRIDHFYDVPGIWRHSEPSSLPEWAPGLRDVIE